VGSLSGQVESIARRVRSLPGQARSLSGQVEAQREQLRGRAGKAATRRLAPARGHWRCRRRGRAARGGVGRGCRRGRFRRRVLPRGVSRRRRIRGPPVPALHPPRQRGRPGGEGAAPRHPRRTRRIRSGTRDGSGREPRSVPHRRADPEPQHRARAAEAIQRGLAPARWRRTRGAFLEESAFSSGPSVSGSCPARSRGMLVNQLLAAHPIKFAVVNSIESRWVLDGLTQGGVPTVSLIHEFAAYTRPKSAFHDAVLLGCAKRCFPHA
jgi:hypothetical protein